MTLMLLLVCKLHNVPMVYYRVFSANTPRMYIYKNIAFLKASVHLFFQSVFINIFVMSLSIAKFLKKPGRIVSRTLVVMISISYGNPTEKSIYF